MKSAKNFCNNLIKRNRKSFLKTSFANNKAFWNTIKLFLTK